MFGAAEGAGGEFGERGSPRGESRIVLVDEEPIGVVAGEADRGKAQGLQAIDHAMDNRRRSEITEVVEFNCNLGNAGEDVGRGFEKEGDFRAFNIDFEQVDVREGVGAQERGERDAFYDGCRRGLDGSVGGDHG